MSNQNDLLRSAHAIASSLFETESSIDKSILNSHSILTQIGEAKLGTQSTVFHGQNTLETLAELMTILTQARRKAGDLHLCLSEMQEQFGLGGIAFGPVGKPTQRLPRSGTETLRVA